MPLSDYIKITSGKSMLPKNTPGNSPDNRAQTQTPVTKLPKEPKAPMSQNQMIAIVLLIIGVALIGFAILTW